MPEGPTLYALKEKTQHFAGHKLLSVTGNAKIDLDRLRNKKVLWLKTWGKHFLIGFRGFTVRVHFLMIGSYLIDADKKAKIRLGLTFINGTLNFYASHIKILEGNINDHYDWSADIMNPKWNAVKAKKKLADHPDQMICDLLLDQELFAGLGNIIKNETLYRCKIHPESRTGKIPKARLHALVKEIPVYAFEFLDWKDQGTLRKHWQAYAQKKCKRCNLAFHKRDTGATHRRSFYCTNCQLEY